MVTSLAEVWIEMIMYDIYYIGAQSLPLRKCGLKFSMNFRIV